MDQENKEDELEAINPYFGSFILETLTLGMYDESVNAIREYVQNAYDSLLQACDEGQIAEHEAKISISVYPDVFIVRDNGTGIKRSVAAERLTSIGASRKEYAREAGFRGIGRLAGLVICDELQFITKASGELTETKVIFNAKQMRLDMAPSASPLTLGELLKRNIKVKHSPMKNAKEHYFEVRLEQLHEAPSEFSDVEDLALYLGQVAPVPYHPDFPFAAAIKKEAKRCGTPLKEIPIHIYRDFQDQSEEPIQVFKHYRGKVLVGSNNIPLQPTPTFFASPDKLWWGWVNNKDVSGAYVSEKTKGLRVRVRNIQIDGTDLMAALFARVPDAPSYGRLYEWQMGEIFANEVKLVPNARRDGFEDNEAWKSARVELIDLCRTLGKRAYETSKVQRLSLKNLAEETAKLEAGLEGLTSTNTDKVIEFTRKAIKAQQKVSKAAKEVDTASSSSFRALEARLVLVHRKSLQHLGSAAAESLNEALVDSNRKAAKKLARLFKTDLDNRCYEKAIAILLDVYGPLN